MEIITLFIGIFFGIFLFNAKRFVTCCIVLAETIAVLNISFPELNIHNYKSWSLESIIDSYKYWPYAIAIGFLFVVVFYWLIPKLAHKVLYSESEQADKFSEFTELGLPNNNILYKASKVLGVILRFFRKSKFLTYFDANNTPNEIRYWGGNLIIYIAMFLAQLSIFFILIDISALFYIPLIILSALLILVVPRLSIIALYKKEIYIGFMDGFEPSENK